MGLVWRSLLVTAVLLVGYHLIIARTPRRLLAGRSAGAIFEENIIAAQDLCYRSDTPKVVILGSSMSRVIAETDAFPPDWCSLGMTGFGPTTGAEVLLFSGKRPAYVLVEINVFLRHIQWELVHSLSEQPQSWLRARLPELRHTAKPNLVLFRALDEAFSQEKGHFVINDIPGSPFYTYAYDENVRSAQKLSPPGETETGVASLRRLIRQIEARGSRIVFFEAPEDPRVIMASQSVQLRDRLKAEFPSAAYAWIPSIDCTNIQTTDFVHLVPSDAKSFARYMIAQLDLIDGTKHAAGTDADPLVSMPNRR